MVDTTLTDAELERLEGLAAKATPGPWAEMNRGWYPMVYGPNGERVCRAVDNKNDTIYIAAACNAVPSLVAEVRRLREKLDKEHSAWRVAEVRGDGLEMENAALRDRVEALEWFVECHDVAIWLNCTNRFTASWEVTLSMIAAREAIR